MGSMFYYAAGIRRWDFLGGSFHKLAEQIVSSANVSDCSGGFNIFFSKLFNHSFFLFEAIYRSFVLCEKLLLILKYYFKQVNFIKNKSLWY